MFKFEKAETCNDKDGDRAWRLTWHTLTTEQEDQFVSGQDVNLDELYKHSVIVRNFNYDEIENVCKMLIAEFEHVMMWYVVKLELVEYCVDVFPEGYKRSEWKAIDEPIEIWKEKR